MVQTLARNKIKNPFFDMSVMPLLSLVSTALSEVLQIEGRSAPLFTAQHCGAQSQFSTA